MNLLVHSQLPVHLCGPLPQDHEQYWAAANKDVTWGWKRDVGVQSRSVYFSGGLAGSLVLYFSNGIFFTSAPRSPGTLMY